MKVEKIFVENALQDSPYIARFQKAFPHAVTLPIDDYRQVFEKVKKPYLHKRQAQNIFLAQKKGELVKLAPPAYGTPEAPHYYFVHAYNCLYECTYCYLQGHFQSPDLVFFLNYQEILQDMEQVLASNPGEVWFHAGEFSDSLAFSHLTGEWDMLWHFFAKHPQAKLELRTKSVNIRELLKRRPLDNMVVSFSLSPAQAAKEYDLLAPSLPHRLAAIQKLAAHGYQIGVHFDPIIEAPGFQNAYHELLQQLAVAIDLSKLQYLSLGVVRFTPEVFHQVATNYPQASFLSSNLAKAPDNKIRYSKAKRQWILSHIEQLARQAQIPSQKIYWCMEADQGLLDEHS